MDEGNLNPQNKNAQLLLRHWATTDWRFVTLTYNAPDQDVAQRADTTIIRLWRHHGWKLHLFLRYLRSYDLVFYPGVHAADFAGLRWRRRLGLGAPVVATLEGLVGDAEREKEYSEWAGHPVFCQRVPKSLLRQIDELLHAADHIIAISPFLAAMGRRRYGHKFSVLPLGIDSARFYPDEPAKSTRVKVVSAGRVDRHKRPELFVELARANPEADFIWYGEGAMRRPLIEQAAAQRVSNIAFPGSKPPEALAEAFRQAHVFVMPSVSEGVPKVTQEAAACGLPVVLFGFYEAPSVIDGHNGFVVWDDEDFFEKSRRLIHDTRLGLDMGEKSARLAKQWNWGTVAKEWQAQLSQLAN
jgi:glycosyltransferase involved in cell wall biosynthesis